MNDTSFSDTYLAYRCLLTIIKYTIVVIAIIKLFKYLCVNVIGTSLLYILCSAVLTWHDVIATNSHRITSSRGITIRPAPQVTSSLFFLKIQHSPVKSTEFFVQFVKNINYSLYNNYACCQLSVIFRHT